MKLRWLNARSRMTAVAAALLGLLAMLAVLQYRWIGQVSQAERERMQANLRNANNQFAREFNYELFRAYQAFGGDPGRGRPDDWPWYAGRWEQWQQMSQYPRLLRGLALVEVARPGEVNFLRFDPASGRLEPAAWPPAYEELRKRLQAVSMAPRFLGWNVAEEIPALVAPLYEFSRRGLGDRGFRPPPDRDRPPPSPPAFLGAVVLELDLEFMKTDFFPELTRRYFGGREGLMYQVAVLSRHDLKRIIFQSDPALSPDAFASPDASVELFGLRPQEFPRFPGGGGPRGGFGRFGPGGPPPSETGRWQLVVKHRSGSLETAVAQARQRNLIISFGVLLLLGSSVVMMMLTTRRAQRLARLQMEFVAGVSHELRTPLSVICSAADNLAAGVVAGAEQSQQYGSLIRNEGRRLSAMVDQILAFATAQSDRRKFEMRPVDVAGVVESALASSAPALDQAGVEVTRQIDSNLPPVLGDVTSLEHCVQNLLSNAVKYGSPNGRGWIGIRAEASPQEVRISVEDKGPGIDPEDLPHIFEPFYRGSRATAAQIHGTGLGLSLVQRIMEAHGGRVTVKTAPGEGSSFTLHLPAAARQ